MPTIRFARVHHMNSAILIPSAILFSFAASAAAEAEAVESMLRTKWHRPSFFTQ